MTDLRGRTALITGASRGIGKAIALRYASLGANVALNYAGDDTTAEATLDEVRAHGVDALLVKADVTQAREIGRLFAETLGRFGEIDIVVANAGVEIIEQSLLEATEEQFDRLFASTRRACSSLCNRPPSMSQTAVGSSPWAPAPRSYRLRASVCTARARWPHATSSACSPSKWDTGE